MFWILRPGVLDFYTGCFGFLRPGVLDFEAVCFGFETVCLC